MFRRGLAYCVVLVVTSGAFANIEIDLRPATAAPYEPGEAVNVEAWFVDKDNGHPITHEDILFRFYQLDFTLTDDTLGLPAEMDMETDEFEINILFPELPRPSLLFPLADPENEQPLFQMTLPAGGEMLIGDLDVTVNDSGWLDVMNPQESVSLGAWARFGFGVDDDDPIIEWGAFTGELTGGRLFMEVPEPGSMVLLAMGVLAGMCRRRRVPPVGAGAGTPGA